MITLVYKITCDRCDERSEVGIGLPMGGEAPRLNAGMLPLGWNEWQGGILCDRHEVTIQVKDKPGRDDSK